MSKNENDEIEVKAILIGDIGVGKTNLINVSTGHKFNPQERTTITSNFVRKKFEIDSQKYCVNLWDTAGQEALKSVTKIFFKCSDIVIFVYDITDKKTLDSLEKWVDDADNILENEHISGIVGNKKDLYIDEKVKEETVRQYAESKNMKFKLVSAKEDPEGFVDFLQELLNDAKPFLIKRKKIELKNGHKNSNKCKC